MAIFSYFSSHNDGHAIFENISVFLIWLIVARHVRQNRLLYRRREGQSSPPRRRLRYFTAGSQNAVSPSEVSDEPFAQITVFSPADSRAAFAFLDIAQAPWQITDWESL